ncbi:MAG: cyclic nucleotide-binding domain-containing protein [Planctomycetes bacterium]|nr:cyclic nucleotide-binding domain-containing protein [Planctomycetota bacterium]MCB9824566.1 cyclic nucleotide-binding domain-containing protein [Planctomycetota bacterium]MCB9900022.1 cyclic nucleotide-binding domain-containing protein [Planctomycetota bacterium]
MSSSPNRLVTAFPWLFDELDPEEVASFVEQLEPRQVAAGSTLIRHGEPCDTLYLLPEGAVAVSLGDGEHPIDLDEGDSLRLVGDLGVIRPGPASATVRAVEAMDGYALTHASLVELLSGAPSRPAARLLLRLAQRIALRVRDGSAVRFESDAVGHGHLRGLLGPTDVNLGELPTALSSMPRHGKGLGKRAPKDAEQRLIEMLRKEPELSMLGDTALVAIARTVEICSCEPGTVLIEQGAVADGAYYLLDGSAAVTARSEGSHFVVDRRLEPGHLFGQIAFLLAGERTATVEVSEPSTVAVFYSAAITWLVDGGAAGAPTGAHVLHWMAGELADDARAQNDRLLQAWSSRKA